MSTILETMEILGGRKVFGKKISDSPHAIPLIEEGFPYKSMAYLMEALDINRDRLSAVLKIPRRTLARRREKMRLAPDESDRLFRLARLLALATSVFGSREKARRWFLKPNRVLGSTVPLEFAGTDLGASEIERVLVRIQHGVFS